MAQEINYLSMIGHGTKGSDGIDEGIHLRWSFDDKLGFPPCFKLYRRENDEGNLYHFPIEHTPISDLILPYSVRVIMNDSLTFKLDSLIREGQEVGFVNVESVTLPNGTSVHCIHITSGELTILFSKPISRLELSFFLESDSKVKIIGLSDNNGLYQPYKITGDNSGVQNISFDIPGATGIKIGGSNIRLTGIDAWLAVKGAGWKQINNLCGCGLPVNQEGTSYTNEYYRLIGKDLAMALCRLGYLRVEDSPITAVEFIELKAMLLTMVGEGSAVPVGWTLFPEDEAEPEATLEFSKYDFLLTQSLQVFFAKILGLYFVDTDAEDGKYYDYKVTAEWPEWNKRRLDHAITFDDEIVETFSPIQELDDYVVLSGTSVPRIVAEPYIVFRTNLGLELTSQNLPIVLSFLHPVTEVQLVIINPDFDNGNITISVEAYRNLYSVYVDMEVLMTERGMLRLRAEQIDSIRIHAPRVILCRVHYDFKSYPERLQEYILCGLKKQNHLSLAKPTGLEASFIPGGTVTDQDGNSSEKPYLAGLRWDANEDPGAELISIAPVLYHIERQPGVGAIELLTEDSPLFVTPSVIESNKRDIPIGWPEERQYYTEAVTRDTLNNYRVAAIDLFGRQSEFTEFVTYEIVNLKPPHPTDVEAKFLDYSTYNLVTDTFSDVTLNELDKSWLRLNRKNAILVNWKWPENFQLQAPDVEGFNIYYKQGWLNTYTGIIVTDAVETVLAKTSLNLTQDELEKYAMLDISPENIPVYEFQILLHFEAPPPPGPVTPSNTHLRAAEREIVPEDAFRLCWLTQSNHNYLILKNNGEAPHPSLWILKLNDIPVKNKGFGIAITSDKEYFINYKDPVNWTDTRVFHQQLKNLTLKEDPETTAQSIYEELYEVYIEDPEFPYPAIAAADRNKVRYAQIGVNAFSGEIEGSVSSPSTIMAIYREVPATPGAFKPQTDEAIQALKATAANVHGKSSFALRWNKINTVLKHQVYRALDETLFGVDNKLRLTRNQAIYNEFKTSHPEFEPDDVDVIKEIPIETNPILVSAHYAQLTPGQLQILASLPDNENAYTKINETTIDENDPVYEDRLTEIPDPVNGAIYTPDPANILLYVDKTLNGQSSNRYFYALRSIDTNGLQSILSLATPPVEIPKTTAPPAPVITSVLGGENQIIIKWAKNPGAKINGYLLYRTQELKKAADWRKMELIKIDTTDLFTVAVNGNLPGKEFEFIDNSVIARQGYYYGLVAVGLSDEGKWLKSKISRAVAGQAYDLTPPDPPAINLIEWIRIDDNGNVFDFDEVIPESETRYTAVRLEWTANDPELQCLVQFSGDYFEEFQNASGWLALSDYSFIHKNSYFYFNHTYRIQVMDQSGNKNADYSEATLTSKVV